MQTAPDETHAFCRCKEEVEIRPWVSVHHRRGEQMPEVLLQLYSYCAALTIAPFRVEQRTLNF